MNHVKTTEETLKTTNEMSFKRLEILSHACHVCYTTGDMWTIRDLISTYIKFLLALRCFSDYLLILFVQRTRDPSVYLCWFGIHVISHDSSLWSYCMHICYAIRFDMLLCTYNIKYAKTTGLQVQEGKSPVYASQGSLLLRFWERVVVGVVGGGRGVNQAIPLLPGMSVTALIVYITPQLCDDIRYGDCLDGLEGCEAFQKGGEHM